MYDHVRYLRTPRVEYDGVILIATTVVQEFPTIAYHELSIEFPGASI